MKEIKEKLQTGTGNAREKLAGFSQKCRAIYNDLIHGKGEYPPSLVKIANILKVFIASTKKFLEDDCLTKASAIAYTTIVSLVPTLTVALTFYSIFSGVGGKKDELFSRVSVFMLEHNIKLNIDPVFAAISGLIDNAGKIGGIGAVVMIFSATAMLRSLENSLNSIWRIKIQRPMVQKIIYYWAVLTLGPVMLISAMTVATMLSDVFSSPAYNSAAITGDHAVWVVGSRAKILHSAGENLKFSELSEEAIDFDNQKVYEFDDASRSFRAVDFRVEPLEFHKTKFTAVQFVNNRGWITGNGGIILSTENRGKTWNLQRWGTFNLNDLVMLNENHGFAVGDSGILLETSDGGKSWTAWGRGELTSNLNTISFRGDTGIIAANRGTILVTTDGGKNWDSRELAAARKHNQTLDLNQAVFNSGDTVWLAGDGGLIVYSADGGRNWESRKFRDNDYYAGYFQSEKSGFIAGEKGRVLYTVNGGETWSETRIPTSRVNKLLVSGNSLWAIGDAGLVMKSTDNGKTWNGLKGRRGMAFVSFLAPFVFIWLLFLLAYMWLPNTKVPFREASLGAAFTAAVWVIFLLLFIVYVKSFASGTFAVYGALASIPLFLLIVYASCVIILYGAEVSYTLMYPSTYRDLAAAPATGKSIHVFYGVSVLHHVYDRFEKGKGASYFKDIVNVCGYSIPEAEFFIKLFMDKNLVMRREDNGLIPANSSANIRLSEVIDLIHSVSLDIPPSPKGLPLRDYMKKLFRDIDTGRGKVVGTTTLENLITKN